MEFQNIKQLHRYNIVDNVEVQSTEGVYIKFEDIKNLFESECLKNMSREHFQHIQALSISSSRCTKCGSSNAKRQSFTTSSGTIHPVMCNSCFRDWMYEEYDV